MDAIANTIHETTQGDDHANSRNRESIERGLSPGNQQWSQVCRFSILLFPRCPIISPIDRRVFCPGRKEPDCNRDTVDNLESTGRMVGNSLGLDFYANGCVPESFWWAGRNELRRHQRTPSETSSAGALKLL